MKLIIKKILNFLIRLKIKILFKFRPGRFLIDKIIIGIFSLKKTVIHNKISLTFHSPNRMNFYRIQTFSTKEPETLEWIDNFKKNKVFWDIGANIGLYSCYAAKKNDCKVFAFEPSIFNLELLSRNIHTNSLSEQITIVPIPLSDNSGFKNFFVTNKDWGGAFSNFGESLDHHGKPLKKNFYYKTLGVSMDEAIKNIKIEQPNYIKMDVDGIEHLILKGASNTLKNVESILIEVNKQNRKQSEEIEKYLIDSNFTIKKSKQIEVIENFKNVPYFFNEIWEKNEN